LLHVVTPIPFQVKTGSKDFQAIGTFSQRYLIRHRERNPASIQMKQIANRSAIGIGLCKRQAWQFGVKTR
jgi:hypothetical protein